MSAEILYSGPRALVLHATCEEACAFVKTHGPYVDVTLTDPPYTAHVQENSRSLTNGADGLRVKAWAHGYDPLADYGHVSALLGVTRRWAIMFCALEQFAFYEAAGGGQWKAGGRYVRSGIWRKQQAAPQLSGDRPANSCEGIAVMHARPCAGRMHWNGRGRHAFWRVDGAWVSDDGVTGDFVPRDELSVEHGRDRSEKRHPAQKPASLCRELVQLFSDPGELILDPYCGSGAIGAAALGLGRRVIAADQDRAWAEHTAARLKALDPPHWATFTAAQLAAQGAA